MNTADRYAWWNIGLWPVYRAGIFSAASQSAGYKPAGRTDWKSMFRLHAAYRRKHPMFIRAPKVTPNVIGNLNMAPPFKR
jgi:hypothetical protein